MGKTRPNPRWAKVHRSYTVEEIAKLYGVHRNTVRAWIKRGLPTLDRRRPVLIVGSRLGEFLRERRMQNKRTCGSGEIYCVRCHEPRAPAGNLAHYHPITLTQGNLVGTCPACSAGLYRRVSAANLSQFHGFFRITLPQAPEHIGETPQPSVISDSMQDAPDHANTSP